MNSNLITESQSFRPYGTGSHNQKLFAWQAGLRSAAILTSALSWLRRLARARQWACRLPREGASAGKDDLARAREALLGAESNLDDRSPAMAVGPTSSGHTWTRAAREQASGFLKRGWYALDKILAAERSRNILCRLSDRELADIGIHRTEIEAFLGGTQQSSVISHARKTESEYELMALRPF